MGTIAYGYFEALPKAERDKILDDAFADMLRGKTLAGLQDLHDRIAAGSGNGLSMVLDEIARRAKK